MKKIFYIMGVSGTGKSTIGKALSDALNLPFFDGDDYHPLSNIKKMASGAPLNDDDRRPWLERLRLLAGTELEKEGAVIACSALKESYREILSHKILEQTPLMFNQRQTSYRLSGISSGHTVIKERTMIPAKPFTLIGRLKILF